MNNRFNFLFIRHGQTTANAANIMSGGDRDPVLTEKGRAQAREVMKVLKRNEASPNIIITSMHERNIETATIVNNQMKLEILNEPLLNERLLGDWNDVSSDTINPELAAGKTPPNGESRDEFRERVMRGFRKHEQHLENCPLIIGSRGIARIFLEKINHPDALKFPNGEVMQISLTNSKDFNVAEIKILTSNLRDQSAVSP